jgi:phytoene/squalene synthetase
MYLFNKTSEDCSRITAENYSTSFASAIKLLHKDLRNDIYNIYGFVRFTDEIVDTFHDYDKEALLQAFCDETYKAIETGISLNPILHSFQLTVNKHQLDLNLIDVFFQSMLSDLKTIHYNEDLYKEYIYGSAEVVGLMCLYIFCEGNKKMYEQLKMYAGSLGAAFQKVNFLRDIRSDNEQLHRMYFPNCNFKKFSFADKAKIEDDIQKDFDNAYAGILLLPEKARFGVYVAYKYYLSLFKKIKKLKPAKCLEHRTRIPDYGKVFIVAKAGLRNHLNIL